MILKKLYCPDRKSPMAKCPRVTGFLSRSGFPSIVRTLSYQSTKKRASSSSYTFRNLSLSLELEIIYITLHCNDIAEFFNYIHCSKKWFDIKCI